MLPTTSTANTRTARYSTFWQPDPTFQSSSMVKKLSGGDFSPKLKKTVLSDFSSFNSKTSFVSMRKEKSDRYLDQLIKEFGSSHYEEPKVPSFTFDKPQIPRRQEMVL